MTTASTAPVALRPSGLSLAAEDLILRLSQEAIDLGVQPHTRLSRPTILCRFRWNHHDDNIEAAAAGDVVALLRLRLDCGLPLVR